MTGNLCRPLMCDNVFGSFTGAPLDGRFKLRPCRSPECFRCPAQYAGRKAEHLLDLISNYEGLCAFPD